MSRANYKFLVDHIDYFWEKEWTQPWQPRGLCVYRCDKTPDMFRLIEQKDFYKSWLDKVA